MKKLLKLTPLVFTLCFIPILISAGTFEDGKNIANKYMENNFEEDYSKYIISEDTKYGFSEDEIFSVSGFSKGGLINKYEFDISKTNSDDSSWLYDMNGYWSLTGDNDNAYVIGKSAYPKTDIYNNRIVEYVRNKTRVTGKGTYSNPWVIDKSYQVIIKANREKLINSIYINNNKCGEDRCETNIIMNRDAVFYINFKDGYEYDTSEGGANLCNAAGYSPTLKKLVISNVVNDVECFFKVKEKEYEITFNANGGTLNEENSKKVTYTKSYGILPEPTKEGYVFTGWYTEQVNGNRIDSSSILDKPEAKTLYAHWSPKSYTVIFDGNNGTPSYSNKTVVYDSKYGSLPTATRTGYTFLGWYTDSINGSVITKDTIVKITSTQTLYAYWKLDKVLYSTLSIYCANYTKGNSPYMVYYSGNCSIHDDGNDNWRIKFLTSGELKISIKTKIDAFLVGGGGVGGGKWGGGGGGGYTKTFNGLTLNSNKTYKVTIGSGGSGGSNTDYPNSWTGSDGESSTIVIDNKTYEAKGGLAGGLGNTSAGCASGGSGGSGGGGGGLWSGSGGTDGLNGISGGYINGANQEIYCNGGSGQNSITREFENSNSTLYASGGKGCGQECSDGYYGYKSASGNPNTGDGGEGGSTVSIGGSGGSGIVIIRNAR